MGFRSAAESKQKLSDEAELCPQTKCLPFCCDAYTVPSRKLKEGRGRKAAPFQVPTEKTPGGGRRLYRKERENNCGRSRKPRFIMDYSSGAPRGKDENGQGNKGVADYPKDVPTPETGSPATRNLKLDVGDPKAQEKAESDEVVGGKGSLGEVNMEAAITTDDFIRAGGFGARDDISSFLPIASDSTDFEASIRDARGYEEPQGETRRPGLGWGEPREAK